MNDKNIRPAMCRPFDKQWLYSDGLLVDRPGGFDKILPMTSGEENQAICLSAVGGSKSFHCLAANCLPDLHFARDAQCFPLYTYALDGKLRRDNVTDWALAQFRAKCGPDVSKRDVFHYVYGLLHSPEYRERYKENLKRELTRLPLVGEPTPAHEFATPPETEGGGAGQAEPPHPPASGGTQRPPGLPVQSGEGGPSAPSWRPGPAWQPCTSAMSRRPSTR